MVVVLLAKASSAPVLAAGRGPVDDAAAPARNHANIAAIATHASNAAATRRSERHVCQRSTHWGRGGCANGRVYVVDSTSTSQGKRTSLFGVSGEIRCDGC